MKKIISFFALALVSACVFAQDPWVLSTNTKDHYSGVSLANGFISLVTSEDCFDIERVILNGVYDTGNGFDAVSTGVEGPKATRLFLRINGSDLDQSQITGWSQSLNLKEASATTEFSCQGDRFKYTQYALRNLPYCLMTEVVITPAKDMDLEVANFVEDGENAREVKRHYQVTNDVGQYIPMNDYSSKTRNGRYEVASATTFLIDDPALLRSVFQGTRDEQPSMNFRIRLKAGTTFRFGVIGAVCDSRDFGTPRNEAMRIVQSAISRGLDNLVSAHVEMWNRLWQSDIIIEGDPQSQQDVRSALYHLYSFVGEDNGESPSPMGLSSNGYNRHVFWDSEIWMYPPLLTLNQKMAKSMVDYRLDRLPQAEKRAGMFGFRGAMFPWESDDSGEEACPVWALTGSMEHHITADVGIAAWNYYCVTQDKKWLSEDGWRLISKVAEYLKSRVARNVDGSYSINNVSGANEYAGNVNDNAFTNGSAKVALLNACSAAKTLKLKADPAWKEIAEGLSFNYFPDGVMKENSGYDGEVIKQADVNLLAYPLGLMTDKEEIRKNLIYYESKIDPKGPAMGKCILSAIYSSLGDKENAFRLFKQSYEPHKCPPFGVLSESAGGSNPYFATGAGGMLQAVIAGFGGLRITSKGIRQENPCLPKEWTSLTITGVGPQKKTFSVK